MKKIAILTVACSVLAGCTYLGEPESYTVVDETVAPVVEPQPAPVVVPTVVATPQPAVCCASRPVMNHAGPCQINPGVSGPLVVNIPAQSVCVQ